MSDEQAEELKGRLAIGEATPGFDDEIGYLERVTITDRAEATRLLQALWGHDEELDPQPIHMRYVQDGSDPEVEANPVPEVPCWLECAGDHPDAVPFWKDAP